MSIYDSIKGRFTGGVRELTGQILPGYLVATLVALLLSGCGYNSEPPSPGSDEYREAVSSFYLSLAASQADEALFAVDKMNELADRYPLEPAAWANLGVYAMRQGDLERADDHLSKAAELAPDNGEITFLQGILASRQGEIENAVDFLDKAAGLMPGNPRVHYLLLTELERQEAAGQRDRIRSVIQRLRELEPDNLALLLEVSRVAVKVQDRSLLEDALARMEQQSGDWPAEIARQFESLKEEILGKPIEEVNFEIAYLRNNLDQLSGFQQQFDRLKLPPNQIGFLITDLEWLPMPERRLEPADTTLRFSGMDAPLQEPDQEVLSLATASGDSIPDLISVAGGRALHSAYGELAFPVGNSVEVLSENMVTEFDYNFDFRNDLAFAGPGGFRLYQNREDSQFVDVTSTLGLPARVVNTPYTGIWKTDTDLDGDLDLVAAPANGPTMVMRNNGDGSFSRIELFGAVRRPVGFAWGDIDADGDPDAVFLDAEGDIYLFQNERMGEYHLVEELPEMEPVMGMQIADLNSDSRLDLVAANDTALTMLHHPNDGGGWKIQSVLSLADFDDLDATSFESLLVQDLDNNGGLDILVSTDNSSRIWLQEERFHFASLDSLLPGRIRDAADFTGDNRLDLVSLDEIGKPRLLVNSGSTDYHARIIRPRASGTVGDRRINSFGIGGEIEVRSGLQYQKKLIDRTMIHFGIGRYEEAEMLRIIWPNGSVQTEFAELGYGSKIFNEQILKGSCPWVFTHNGEEMEFVTDFLWRTALGLRINAQGDAGVVHSIDWIKIEEDQLKPVDGYYDVRITAELWESHFFDRVSLMVVDHPKDMPVLVDERFAIPPPDPKLYAMNRLNPVKAARNYRGTDVTSKIEAEDSRYVDQLPLTGYQGITEEHYLELELGEIEPGDAPVWLVGSGWIYPTDSSINVAISQGQQKPPHGLQLQIPGEDGKWTTVKDNLGFPAGKHKTILIRLDDLARNGRLPERVRLKTNMEIYWDRIAWSQGKSDPSIQTRTLKPAEAKLRYRGFSRLTNRDRLLPTEPDYGQLMGTTPIWNDLVGYHTRFGDVMELIENTDDRYVIMNAGDELRFRFPVPDPPEKGWEREFVLIGDGWVKDGDLNTGYSTTVLPLPYHGMEDYADAPGSLQDDPVYKKHREDWAIYHTRYITPDYFRSAIRMNPKVSN